MPRGRRDHQLRARPDLVQVPRVLHRADHVVAAVDDDARDVRQAMRVAQQLVLDFEEATVDEIVVLDAREGVRKLRFRETRRKLGIGKQRDGLALPEAPGACGLRSSRRIRAGETLAVGRDQIAALGLRDRREKTLPLVGKEA